MFDSVLNKTFSYTNPESYSIEWFGQNKFAEPIWITNQKGGENRRSAAEWVGSNVPFGNQTAFHVPYNHSTPYNEYIDIFTSLFVNESDPINFGALYFDEPGKELSVKSLFVKNLKYNWIFFRLYWAYVWT